MNDVPLALDRIVVDGRDDDDDDDGVTMENDQTMTLVEKIIMVTTSNDRCKQIDVVVVLFIMLKV
jgi:type IV secretory pathway VirD2 relaxase